MPTGYTHPVVDGTITEFPQFAMSCARAFGALVTMRDDPTDAPIPEELKPSTYNSQALTKARARLSELRAMTTEQADVAATDSYNEAVAHAAEYEESCRREEARLDAMLEKVRKWEAPTAEHDGLKDFMVEQLSMSKRGSWRPDPPKKMTGREWLNAGIEKANRDIEYHAAEQAKEDERTRGRTEWVKALRASLVSIEANR